MGTKALTRSVITSLVILCVAAGAQALVINPTFSNNAGETWTAARQGVINQAIADWQAVIDEDQTVDVTVTFANAGAGGYLGQWQGGGGFFAGTDIYPWTDGAVHTITFNADLFSGANYIWWDPTPETDGDVPSAGWDALSTARHEIGHMMGFTEGYYVDNFLEPGQLNRWLDQVTGTTFDPGGLNVSLAASWDKSHVLNGGATAGDLMNPSRLNGVRSDISMTDLEMLALAHGYTIIPEPLSLALFAIGACLPLLHRRR